MGKNRMRALRNITVQDEKYVWSVVDGILQIWKDKKSIHKGDTNYDTVTPKQVAEIIAPGTTDYPIEKVRLEMYRNVADIVMNNNNDVKRIDDLLEQNGIEITRVNVKV